MLPLLTYGLSEMYHADQTLVQVNRLKPGLAQVSGIRAEARLNQQAWRLRVAIDLTSRSDSIYCERTSPHFWAEILNATSSLFVIAVGVIGFVYLLRTGRLTPVVSLLALLGIAIGLGSFLLHTFATRWAELADVIPIWAFVVVFGLSVIVRSSRGAVPVPLAIIFGAAIFSAGTAMAMGGQMQLARNFSGSFQYVPALLMIAGAIWFLWKRGHPSFWMMASGAALFLLALAFRSLDMALCPVFPYGTHFLWHLTNTAVFWVLLAAFVVHVPAPPERHDG